MTMRTAPAETDRFRYHLDELQIGGTGLGFPSLREILEFACMLGDTEGIHDDADRAAEFARTCTKYLPDIQNAMYLDLMVAEARKLYDACMSAWDYADQNHYGADDEEDDRARVFGQDGKFMLHALARPWASLSLTDDGYHGFERI
jgi:hypothetical protein